MFLFFLSTCTVSCFKIVLQYNIQFIFFFRSLTVTETTGALDGTSYQFPWKLDSCGLDRYCQVTMTKLAYDLKYMDVKSLMLVSKKKEQILLSFLEVKEIFQKI